MIKVAFYLNDKMKIENVIIEKVTRPIAHHFFNQIESTLAQAISRVNDGLPINSRYKAKLTPSYEGVRHLEVEEIICYSIYA